MFFILWSQGSAERGRVSWRSLAIVFDSDPDRYRQPGRLESFPTPSLARGHVELQLPNSFGALLHAAAVSFIGRP
jgi:hypothetical protein